MTQFDMLLRRALMDANLAQYERALQSAEDKEPDFSPRYLRERTRLLADPRGWGRRRAVGRPRRLNWRLIAIVAALLLLSACAVAVATGQFSQWSPRLGVDPEAPEVSEEVLSRAGTVIEQTKTVGDATVTLHGAVRDEDVLWLSLTVESPDIPEELTPGSPLSSALYTEECFMTFRRDQWREHLEAFYAKKGLPPEELEASLQSIPGEEAPKYHDLNFILLSREGNTLTFEVEEGFRLYVERPEITLHLENIAPYEGGTILPDDDVNSYRGNDKMFKDKNGELRWEYKVGNEGILTEIDKKAKEKYTVNGDFPKNKKGESYGSMLLAEYVGYAPDLTQMGDGYIRMDERQAEADKLNGLSEEECPHEYTYFLYNQEGEVIEKMKGSCGGHYDTSGMTKEEVRQAIIENRL